MALQAIDRLILIRVKVEWAKKRLRDLAAETLPEEYAHVLIRDENTGIAPHPITIEGKVPPVRILSFDAVCIAGDVIHSLRASLDHLAQQLAAVYTPTISREELRRVEFPITETFAKYKAKDARIIKGIHPDAIKTIDALKPYGDGDGPLSAALWRLHYLDIIDKHRGLFTLGPEFLFTASWFDGAYHFKAGNPNFAGIEADVEKDLQLEIEETVNKAKVRRSNAVLPTLHQLAEVVENLILGFEPFLE
jgi:hypothetical protein